jgi:hypothetical protein
LALPLAAIDKRALFPSEIKIYTAIEQVPESNGLLKFL